MAAEGMKLTDFYSAATVCTPSRAALLTGSYPQRIGIARYLFFPGSKKGLNTGELTIAKLLKKEGYATACIGKWHLGDHAKFHPMNHGFESFFGLPYSNDMLRTNKKKKWPELSLFRNRKVIEMPVNQTTLTQRYTEEAVDFIKKNKGQPFFLYLPHTMPHVPLYASKNFRGQSKRGLYGDVVEEIDWSTGRILKTIKEIGADKNTLVIFTSDNGPWLAKGKAGGSALPLRSGKGTTYEGGMRVPCIAWYPGFIPSGSKSSEIATTMDFLPTIADMTGIDLPESLLIDGKTISHILKGVPMAKSAYKVFYYYAPNGKLEAVRRGKWKYIMARKIRIGKKKWGLQEEALYDLNSDIGESNNLINKNPELVKIFQKQIKECLEDIGERGHPGKNTRPIGSV